MSAREWRQQDRLRRFIEEQKALAEFRYRYFVGVDLGQRVDSTILAAIEEVTHKSGEIENNIIAIDELPLGMPYTDQARAIVEWHQKEPFKFWGVKTLVDNNSIGSATGDMLAELGLRFTRVNITSGESISHHDGRLHVSRSRLISNLLTFLSKPNTYINSDSPNAERFCDEFLSLEIDHSKHGKSFVADGHDDCMAAVGLAAIGYARRINTGVRPLY